VARVQLPSVILFDLDDTLLSFSAGRDFWPDAYEAQTAGSTHVSAEKFHEAIKRVAPTFWSDAQRASRGRLDLVWARRQVAALAFAEVGLNAPELARAVADDFTWRKEDSVAPFEGAINTLASLKSRGVRLGLITNGHADFQRRKLARYQLEPFFEAVLIESEWSVGKPDPSIFCEALRRLAVGPTDTWMVGDNLEADIAGAQPLGIYAIWHDHARLGVPTSSSVAPDRVIHHVRELL
jgi:putative hydrolase of the HAD superfamily